MYVMVRPHLIGTAPVDIVNTKDVPVDQYDIIKYSLPNNRVRTGTVIQEYPKTPDACTLMSVYREEYVAEKTDQM